MSTNKSKRGRPDANQSGLEIPQVETEVQRSEEREPERPARVPMTNTLKLQYNHTLDLENYFYRWFRSENGRLDQAKAAYYEHVKDDQGGNVIRAYRASEQYLMRIPLKYYKEDQKLKEDALKGKLKTEQELSKDEYLPDDRHHTLQADDYDPLAG